VTAPPLRAVPAALAWLLHPATIAATVLLIANDHLLKRAWPGPVTGKLSDVAGLVLAPPVLGLLLALTAEPCLWRSPSLARAPGPARRRLPSSRRSSVQTPPALEPCLWRLPPLAIGLVGVGFTAVKVSPLVAGYASTAWSLGLGRSVLRSDPGDLVALPALWLAWYAWRTRPVPGRLAQRLAVLVLLPTAVLGIAATSAARYDDAVSIIRWQDTIVVGIGDAAVKSSRDPRSYHATTDGGRNFHLLVDPELAEFGKEAHTPVGPLDCVPDDPRHCFRVVPGHLRVEETADGGTGWRVAWEVPDEERARLAKAFPELGDVNEYLSSRALIVRAEGTGFVVLVVNGRDGMARRDPDGSWRRIGFGVQSGPGYTVTVEPTPIPGVNAATAPDLLPYPFALASALAAWVIFLGSALAARRGTRHWSIAIGGILAALGSLVLLGATLVAGSDSLFLSLVISYFGVLIMLASVITSLSVARGLRLLSPGRIVALILVALAGAAGVLVPFLTWLATGVPARPLAVTIATAAALLALAGGAALARTAPAPAPGEHELVSGG
jgi:hypothetical protein